ncbi:glycosyltransferase [Oxalobacteraceae sp. CFBP 13730]|nr:glycosyltransferase [Oxalobacteraceae sp. CFBP 13730]
MQFTGERYMPTEAGRIQLEHYHRYATVMELVSGKTVLDVACGEGYGSAMLADAAVHVTGVDISDEAVEHAARSYQKANLVYRQGSAIALDFADASFDVVVSFETIEHLAEQEDMLREIRRVLRPQGVLVISSPNRPVYSEESGEHNEFHVKELDFGEFDALLKQQFGAIRYLGQRMLMGSVIQLLDGQPSAYRAWHLEGTQMLPGAAGLTDAVYFVAVCAADAGDLPSAVSTMTSLLYPEKLDLVKHYVGFAKWAQDQNQVIAERDAEKLSLIEILKERDLAIGARDAQVLQLTQAVEGIAERDAEKLRLIEVLNERDLAIGARDAQVRQLTQAVEGNAVQAAHSAGQIDGLNQAISAGYRRVEELARTVAQYQAWTTQANQGISERDDHILRQNKLRLEREGQLAEKTAHIAHLNELIVARDGQVAHLDNRTLHLDELIVARDGQIAHLDRLLAESEGRLQRMAATNSWRLTLPLREARRWLSSPKQQLRRYGRAALTRAGRSSEAQAGPAHASVAPPAKLASVSVAPPAAAIVPVAVSVPAVLPEATPRTSVVVPAAILPSAHPLVSVVIPIYGKIDYTLRCLASIAAHPPAAAFEVIVVDDCSPDDSVAVLNGVPGIRLVRNEVNQGFIRSCNHGARLALGEYVYFLNNDTEVLAGWMDELLRTFATIPGTGLAGSKLLYPDGRLQEAGGIIWQDASAWNFGRFQDPALPVYNYARDVDYISGASIMLTKALFDDLGGFDELYLPAYCEDADLALKIRARGYRVIYQPLSAVIHHEGISSGTDTSQGVKAYQIENFKKLYQRWHTQLNEHMPNGINVDAEKDRGATRRALVLDHCTPTPNQDAGSVIAYNIMLLLRDMGFQVTFIAEDNFLYMPEYTAALQRAGIEVLYAPYVISVEQHLVAHGARYDLVSLFRPGVVDRHLAAVRRYCPKAKALFHTVDLHFLRMSREAALQADAVKQRAADAMKQRELAAICLCDGAILHSTVELEMVRRDLPTANLHVFPLVMDIPGTRVAFAQREDIVFVGGYQHTPNVDAVQYFVAEVMPLLRQRLPGVRFYVVGSQPPPAILALAADDIVIKGFVDDLAPLLDTMRVSVAPLRYGAGIKGKIGSAMAQGLPVVATPLAAEGMSLTDGLNILIADGAAALADTIVRLYRDEALWNHISAEGVAFADAAWGAEAAWQSLAAITTNLGMPTERGERPLNLYS